MIDVIELLGGPPSRLDVRPAPVAPPLVVVDAGEDAPRLRAYRDLRRRAFVEEQRLFASDDGDEWDEHPSTIFLTAVASDGSVLGGVRLHPAREGGAELGWWQGSRLVAASGPGVRRGEVGAALVRAACGRALEAGAIRFDAHVQTAHAPFFTRLGWESVRTAPIGGAPHLLMRWPVERIAEHALGAKESLGELVGQVLAQDRWRGDDGVPLAGTDVIACTDAITPSMVDRDPAWAGWCGMLVTANDLAAMGASPVGVLDAIGGRDAAHVSRVLRGIREGAEAFDLPVLGGHTQLGVPGALTVTGLGRTPEPVPGGGGRPGDAVWVCADLEGQWRPGYHGRQWDSSSRRTRDELRPMLDLVRRTRPKAAKDASMAGIVGTIAMLAEASGCGAEIDIARVPRPEPALMADWLTCFPGFAVVLAQSPGAPPPRGGAAVSSGCGRLSRSGGVRLRWPDDEITTVIATEAITGLGPATGGCP
ncbi:MAG TPA: MSMEG_0567/sll0787 family protein [Solirubrobacteraceae bacterium]|jgi:putative N-acetyltransferase (TIGR04045 family)|nr:MSMEG_0567/sll0787 family protein [Solirubrobacteraceae bacterium]